MNKNELEYARIEASAAKFGLVIGLLRTIFRWGAGVIAVYFVMDGLKGLIPASEGQLNAMANLVSALKAKDIALYVVTIASVTGYAMKSVSARRAIGLKSYYQAIVESGDLNRTSSGLSSTGETP